MTQLASYLVPGFAVSDHVVRVPLDWSDESWGTIDCFYREVTAVDRRGEDLPLLVYLAGGPGGAAPRPGPDVAWLAEATRRYRVILPDQRGTGRSNPVDGEDMARFDEPPAAAWYLRHFLADSIVRDLEHVRRHHFGGRPWTVLGQSYGGFITLTYLSRYPDALGAALIAGGLPGLPPSAGDVYRLEYPAAERKSRAYYRRYPQDEEIVGQIAERLAEGDVVLPNGDPLTVRRFQMLGRHFGSLRAPERLHWLFDRAFARPGRLSDAFLYSVMDFTAGADRPLYWPLLEFIYASGANGPVEWAAAHEFERHPEFAEAARPLLFFGEMAFPWMFADIYELRPFRAAVERLMHEVKWPNLYDAKRLAANTVPVEAVIYHDDLFVDAGCQLETLQGVDNAQAWVTNEFDHDGLGSDPKVFAHLLRALRERGGEAAA